MKNAFKDVPWDVQKVMVYQTARYVGSEVYKECQETIKKYPEWFPWETTYNAIPQEVHDAYVADQMKLYDVFYSEDKSDFRVGEGMMAYYDRKIAEQYEKEKANPHHYTLEASLKRINERDKKDRDYKVKLRLLWGKHYGKYKLKYRE